jgi:hypothetical protein
MPISTIIIFLVFALLVYKTFLFSWFVSSVSHGTIITNIVENWSHSPEPFFVLVLFISGSFLLYRLPKNKGFFIYVQIIILVVIPLCIAVLPLGSVVSHEINLRKDISPILSEYENLHGMRDFSTLKSLNYDPLTKEVTIELVLKTEVILNEFQEMRKGQKMKEEYILRNIQRYVANDVGTTYGYFWNATLVPKKITVDLFWKDYLIHRSEAGRKEFIFPDRAFHFEIHNEKLVLQYEVNGERKSLILSE